MFSSNKKKDPHGANSCISRSFSFTQIKTLEKED